MPTLREKSIFKNGSKTYFYSSMFFPKDVKNDVFTLYSYVRTADDFVDSTPQDKKGFYRYKQQTNKAFKGLKIKNEIISRFRDLCIRKNIKTEWVESFLQAMESDLYKNKYQTFYELEKYMYGSAEVIGLMMSCILDLPEKAYKYAALQGKAMQLINFIRDIKEDTELNREYLPDMNDSQKFNKNILSLIAKYNTMQKNAEKGYKYIPRSYRTSIKTAADLYKYTAKKISRNPEIVFYKKVKPSLPRIIITGIKNYIT